MSKNSLFFSSIAFFVTYLYIYMKLMWFGIRISPAWCHKVQWIDELFYTSLMKIWHTVCQLSGVSARFQVYRPCLHVAHRNTRVNGANFILNRNVNTLKSLQTCLHSLIFRWISYTSKPLYIEKVFEYKVEQNCC